MTTRKYWSVLTAEGKKRLTTAALSGEAIDIEQMAVGDGNGSTPIPDENKTGLVNEIYRAKLNRLIIADTEEDVIRAELIIPSQIGGFTLREAALFAHDGACLAICNLPETYKPLLSEGSGRMVAVNFWLKVSNAQNVTLIADPTIMMATVGEVNKAVEEAKGYTNAEIVALDKAIREAISSAVREAWESDNPVGTVKFYAQNINPNLRYPWSKWVYTGEERTIRIGQQNGSDVGTTGGSDTVNLERVNLPSITLKVRGEAEITENSTLETKKSGKHNHTSDDRFNKLSAKASDIDNQNTPGETDNRYAESEYRVTGMAGLWESATMIDAEDHVHKLDLPGHSHVISGKTESLGEGEDFSVVNAHILLMCWARVA